ncbi:hypothetical protein B0H10DRAFT_338017 [Mycena sp. CBHHK59/15]|nr:hypothetical protein B0H10DRAFT_338017 [Mycena sp. CBHHK59/15]
MKVLTIPANILLLFTGVVASNYSLIQLSYEITSLGETISQLGSTIDTFAVFAVNDTDPLGLYRNAIGLVPKLDRINDALQEHSPLNEKDGNTIFTAVQNIEPAIKGLITAVSANAVFLSGLDVHGVPDPVMREFVQVGSTSRRFDMALRNSTEVCWINVHVRIDCHVDFRMVHNYIRISSRKLGPHIKD